jgi:hypothetical protein
MSMTDNGQPNPVFEGASASPTPAQIAAQQNAAGFHAGTTAAQQPQGQQVPFTGQQAPSGFSAEDIEKARNEERQKLYPQLQSVEQMKADLEALKAEREAEKKRLEEAEAARLQAEREAEEAKLSATALNTKRIDELAQQLEAERKERGVERAVFDQERRLAALQQYAQNKLAVAGNTIIPELWDMVTGDTEEEIDASIALLQQKTANMIGQLQETMVAQRQAMPGTMPTAPANGPLENQQGQQKWDEERVKALTPAQYAQHRGTLLPAAGAAWRQQHGR